MREVAIRKLRSELSTQLANLPFAVTKNGNIVAVMCTQEDYIGTHLQREIDAVKKIPIRKDTVLEKRIKVMTDYFNPRPKGKDGKK